MSELHLPKIILGSGSPRRKELLAACGLSFEVLVRSVEEPVYREGDPESIAKEIADLKLNSYADLFDDHLVICADTVVALEQKIFGKPENHTQATEMLTMLSGKTHRVVTGVAIGYKNKKTIISDQTEVTFKSLTAGEIEYYINNYQPMDKAGAYGIQEWIGHIGVTNVRGEYNNVVGLPTARLMRELTAYTGAGGFLPSVANK